MTTSQITKTYTNPAGITHAFTFLADGWFNMTKAAQAFDKKLSNFWDSPEIQGYVDALVQLPGFQGIALVIANRGRHGGTWAHPNLALRFAQWLDLRFAVWCDAVIEDFLKGGAQVTITKPEEAAALAVPPSYAAVVPEWRSGR